MPKRLRHAADLLTASNVPVRRAAGILSREPESPVTQAVKLWGDDEEPFKNLITSRSPAAHEWRRVMARIIANLKPDRSNRPVWRGWYFASAEQRASFLAQILRDGLFINPRIGMSATRTRRVATGASFLNRHGMVWEIRSHRSARDVAPIFAAIEAKYPEQREVLFPQRSRFVLLEPHRAITLVRGGQKLRVPYLVFAEA